MHGQVESVPFLTWVLETCDRIMAAEQDKPKPDHEDDKVSSSLKEQ